MSTDTGTDEQQRQVQIAVIGPGTCTPGEYTAGQTAGRILAENRAIVLCGGRGGVMEAACRGAREVNGTTVGILPDTTGGNPYLSVVIRSDLGIARNAVLVLSADAVVALGGAYGTLSEISHALQGDIPVIGLNTWSLSRNGKPADSIIPAQSPTEAVSKALEMIILLTGRDC